MISGIWQEIVSISTARTDIGGHVLNESEDGKIERPTERLLPSDDGGCHLLWRGDQNAPVGVELTEGVQDGEMLVRSPGRGVNEEPIQSSPQHIGQQSPDEVGLARPPPHDRVCAGR